MMQQPMPAHEILAGGHGNLYHPGEGLESDPEDFSQTWNLEQSPELAKHENEQLTIRLVHDTKEIHVTTQSIFHMQRDSMTPHIW